MRRSITSRRLMILVLTTALAVGLMVTLRASRNFVAAAAPAGQQLTLTERVAYQRAIEQVYWKHRIWPTGDARTKPALEHFMPPQQMRAKVDDYLLQSVALAVYWHSPITGEQLQSEMEEMAQRTQQPAVLRELYAALGDSPRVIAECLVRPVLVERRLRERYAAHGRQDAFETWWGEARRNLGMAVGTTRYEFRLPSITATAAGCAIDAWVATSTTGAPAGRTLHKAVWTGTEMIIWGGQGAGPHPDFPNTGGRYNAATNSWTPTSTVGAPIGRRNLSAVWTGTEMIVWGGQDSTFSNTNTGGRYNPATNAWTATPTLGTPPASAFHSAVWTGTEMIVWSGQNSSFQDLNTGGRYNPATDSWIAISGAMTAGVGHTAVWTGSEMVVWGGALHNNAGGRYNPVTDSWTLTSTTNAPTARIQNGAVWTGSEMIVWGGLSLSGRVDTGGRYDPATDSWIATTTTNAPSARQLHTAVWTGSEMIVWGGIDPFERNTGGRYDPASDSWTMTTTANAPSARPHHNAVWTGTEMIVWGGGGELNTGGRYCQGPANIPPVASCKNVTISADASGTSEVSIDDGSYDPDNDPLTLAQTPAGPYPVGVTSVMLTVSDGKGGSSSCTATVTVTPFGPPPGDPAPGDKPSGKGSVLVYNYYTSSAATPSVEDTFIELSNTHKERAVFVHLFFIEGSSGALADAFLCLAPRETFNFRLSDYDPGNQGYILAIATDANGLPSNHNFLSGRAEIKKGSGHFANFGAVAVSAVASVPAMVPLPYPEVTLYFDDLHYRRIPRVVELDPVPNLVDGTSTLLIVNRLGGRLTPAASGIGAFQGVLTNLNTAAQLNFSDSQSSCQINRFLSDAFPLTSPVFSTALLHKQEGSLKLWAANDYGLVGAWLTHNPDKKAKKLNNGGNLGAVTLTTSSLIVPVFPPSC